MSDAEIDSFKFFSESSWNIVKVQEMSSQAFDFKSRQRRSVRFADYDVGWPCRIIRLDEPPPKLVDPAKCRLNVIGIIEDHIAAIQSVEN